ncbi:Guanine nucleotide-binding protein-like 3-like protein [Diplonema papillatum]|nr:Guanine nucleotide-binding protein-like 3-like protein [Diplonema papillatum]
MGKKGGHGRAGGKRNEPRGGGGNAAAKRSLPELRESVGKRQDVGLPQLGKYSKKMEKVLQNQHKRQFDSERPGKKRKVQEGDDGADAPMETGDMKSQLALLMLAANSSKNEYEAKQEFVEENALEIAAASNRSRENSKRRFWKEFQKVVKVSDVLLEVLDARDPLGCRLSDVEKTIDSQYAGKKHFVLVLNKVDLVPKENVIKWLDYFRVEGIPIVAFSAAGGGKAAAQETSSSKDHTDPHHRCVHHLFDVLKKFQRTEAGGRRHITVGIIGFPNVGKSSVINALKRERVVGVGNTPGFTTTAQEVTLQGHVKVVDCPGMRSAFTLFGTETTAVKKSGLVALGRNRLS